MAATPSALVRTTSRIQSHMRKAEFLPAAVHLTYGSLDLCLVADEKIDAMKRGIEESGCPIEEGRLSGMEHLKKRRASICAGRRKADRAQQLEAGELRVHRMLLAPSASVQRRSRTQECSEAVPVSADLYHRHRSGGCIQADMHLMGRWAMKASALNASQEKHGAPQSR